MLDDTVRIENLTDLRTFVHQTICDNNELEFNAFSMSERILVRGGRPCGIFFCLYGPRAVKLTAIWETDRNSVLFYSATGERMLRSQLTHAPSLVPAA
jgi:hypothetical protein